MGESVREVFGFEASIARMDDDQELVAGIQHLNVNSSGELTVGNVTHTASSEDGKTTFGSPSKLAADATKRSNYNMAAIRDADADADADTVEFGWTRTRTLLKILNGRCCGRCYG